MAAPAGAGSIGRVEILERAGAGGSGHYLFADFRPFSGRSAPISAPVGRGGLKIGLSILIFCEESFGKHNKTTFLTKFREHPKQKHALNVFYRNQRELPPRHTQRIHT